MKTLALVFVAACAFSTTAMAADIAISTQAGWWSQGAADREMQEIVDNVTAVAVEQFATDNQAALADWVTDHTGDGAADLLILCGQFPDTMHRAMPSLRARWLNYSSTMEILSSTRATGFSTSSMAPATMARADCRI